MKTTIVTNLKRQATKILAELAEDHDTVLITEHGRPAAYLVDVETYELQQTRLRVLEGIARGERAVEQGRTVDHDAAKTRLARWLDD
jgi:prevent-host-death family protein